MRAAEAKTVNLKTNTATLVDGKQVRIERMWDKSGKPAQDPRMAESVMVTGRERGDWAIINLETFKGEVVR